MNDKLTVEDAIARLAHLIEHYIDERGCSTFEEATTQALEQMEEQNFYFVHGDDIDGG